MSTSSEQALRDKIISALKNKELISTEELQKLGKKYTTGKVTAEDWVMHIESSIVEDGKNEKTS